MKILKREMKKLKKKRGEERWRKENREMNNVKRKDELFVKHAKIVNDLHNKQRLVIYTFTLSSSKLQLFNIIINPENR